MEMYALLYLWNTLMLRCLLNEEEISVIREQIHYRGPTSSKNMLYVCITSLSFEYFVIVC